MGQRWSQLSYDRKANEFLVRLTQLRHTTNRELEPDEVHAEILRLCEGWAVNQDGILKPAEILDFTRQENFGLSPTEHYRAYRASANAYIHPYLLSFVDEGDRTNWGRGGRNLYRKSLTSFFGGAPGEKSAWYGIIYERVRWVGTKVKWVDYRRWDYFAFALIKREKKEKGKKGEVLFEPSRTLVIFDPWPLSVTAKTRPKDLRPLEYHLWHLARNSGRKDGKSRRKVNFYYSQDKRFRNQDHDLTACLHWVDYFASLKRQTIASEHEEILENCYQITRC